MQQVDARLNEWQGALDGINGVTLTDARVFTNNLAAANSEVVVDINGKATCTFFVACVVTMAANDLVVEGTMDGTNFFALPYYIQQSTIPTHPAESVGVSISPTAMAAGQFCTVTVSATGWRRVRMRKVSATGNANVSLRASAADYRIIAQPQPSLLNVSLAALAINTGGTITLPAAGAGLFHYITAFDFQVSGGAAANAAAAAPSITTTNLPGNPLWRFGIPATAGGFQAFSKAWTNPLKSVAANTATTFVCPIPGSNSVISANVSYYVGA
jgi:hypothetical protein